MEDLATLQESRFQAAKMTKRCSRRAMYSSAKSLMYLEENHCQATKWQNSGFVAARYLKFEGLETIEESHF
jgi:hypothetical protein